MNVLVVGATGMLGRPVTHRLVNEGFAVRAYVRNASRAQRILPPGVQFAEGDLRDRGALRAALAGVDAVYTSLNTPFSPRTPFDPDRDGTQAVLAAAREVGVRRFVRLSAMGVPAAAAEFWSIERKAQTDQALIDSGLDWTLFRPTWFMESLPLFSLGPFLVRLGLPATGLCWLAGDDYGRMVAAALRSPATIGRAYDVEGPESLSFRAALARFAQAAPRRLMLLPAPRFGLEIGRWLLAKPAYFRDLLRVTFAYQAHPAPSNAPELPAPRMRIEEYAQYVRATGDWPRK